MHRAHKEEMIGNIKEFLENEPYFYGKSVILFGHCNATEELADYLLAQGVTPLCFLDNNQEKQGGNYKNIEIFHPNYIKNYSGQDSMVLIASRYFSLMLHQLRQLGYEGEVIETVEYSSYQSFSSDDVTFSKKKQRILWGKQQLDALRREWGQEFLVVCPFAALGDVYWAMAYLSAYCHARNIPSCTIAVVGNGCKQVASLFGYEHISVFEQKQMDALVQLLVFTHEKEAIIPHHDHLYTDTSLKLLQRQLIPFTTWYQEVIYGLPQTAKAVAPMKKAPLSEEGKREMSQGNTVIFAPYAHSIAEVSLSFWENLVVEYKKKGLVVLTNVAAGQAPLSGTKGVSFPLHEMISAVEYGGHFVGMRSGLCDVLHSAQCQKTLVFPSCYFSTTPHLVSDFFALEGWETLVVTEAQ